MYIGGGGGGAAGGSGNDNSSVDMSISSICLTVFLNIFFFSIMLLPIVR